MCLDIAFTIHYSPPPKCGILTFSGASPAHLTPTRSHTRHTQHTQHTHTTHTTHTTHNTQIVAIFAQGRARRGLAKIRRCRSSIWAARTVLLVHFLLSLFAMGRRSGGRPPRSGSRRNVRHVDSREMSCDRGHGKHRKPRGRNKNEQRNSCSKAHLWATIAALKAALAAMHVA